MDYQPLDGSTPEISVSGPSGNITAGPAGDLSYPLSATGPTSLTLHRSGLPEDLTQAVLWKELDLANNPLNGQIQILKGDSLLLDSPQKAKDVFAEYLVTAAMQKARKAACLDYAAANGPIEVNGKVLGHELVDKVHQLDKAAVVAHLIDSGRLEAIQTAASALVSGGEATPLAHALADAGLVTIDKEPREKIGNS